MRALCSKYLPVCEENSRPYLLKGFFQFHKILWILLIIVKCPQLCLPLEIHLESVISKGSADRIQLLFVIKLEKDKLFMIRIHSGLQKYSNIWALNIEFLLKRPRRGSTVISKLSFCCFCEMENKYLSNLKSKPEEMCWRFRRQQPRCKFAFAWWGGLVGRICTPAANPKDWKTFR